MQQFFLRLEHPVEMEAEKKNHKQLKNLFVILNSNKLAIGTYNHISIILIYIYVEGQIVIL